MANNIEWGKAHINNTNEYGKGSEDNLISWGITYGNTWFGQTLVESAEEIAQLLLDLYPAEVAYSLDKIKNDYTGPVITVRRSSDGTERDFGFNSNGNLDTGSLEPFVDGRHVYISQFTTGSEDLTEVKGTVRDGVSVLGVDDAYEFTLDGGSGVHRVQLSNLFEYGENYTVSFDYYIPAGQTVTGLVGPIQAGNVGYTEFNITGSWQSVSVNIEVREEGVGNSNDTKMRIQPWDGTTTVLDANDDVFYLKNIVVSQANPKVNMVLYSNTFDNVVWSDAGGALSVTGGQTGYDGSSDAWLLDKTDAGNLYFRQSNVDNMLPGENYTVSLYAKSGSLGGIMIYCHDWVRVNLTDGSTITTGNNPVATSVTDVGAGWYRVSVSGDFNSGTWNRVSFKPQTSTGNDATGSIYVQDVQFEKGATVSTYNETTANQNGFGYVVEWKDQSGNGNNATQTNETQQPKIVDAGAVITENGKPAIYFDGTNDYFTGAVKTTMDNTAIFAVIKSDSNTQDAVFIQNFLDTNNLVSLGLGGIGTANAIGSRLRVGGSNVDSVGDSTFTATDQTLVSYLADNAAGQMFIDGTEETDAVDSRNGGSNTTIGARGDGTYTFNGKFQELIFFDSDQSDNRLAIETDINSRYNIYS